MLQFICNKCGSIVHESDQYTSVEMHNKNAQRWVYCSKCWERLMELSNVIPKDHLAEGEIIFRPTKFTGDVKSGGQISTEARKYIIDCYLYTRIPIRTLAAELGISRATITYIVEAYVKEHKGGN